MTKVKLTDSHHIPNPVPARISIRPFPPRRPLIIYRIKTLRLHEPPLGPRKPSPTKDSLPISTLLLLLTVKLIHITDRHTS